MSCRRHRRTLEPPSLERRQKEKKERERQAGSEKPEEGKQQSSGAAGLALARSGNGSLNGRLGRPLAGAVHTDEISYMPSFSVFE